MPTVTEKYVVLFNGLGHFDRGAVVSPGQIAPSLQGEDADRNLSRLLRQEAIRPATEFESSLDRVDIKPHSRSQNRAVQEQLSEKDAEINELRAENVRLNGQLTAFRQQLSRVTPELPNPTQVQAKEAIAAKDRVIESLQSEIAKLKSASGKKN